VGSPLISPALITPAWEVAVLIPARNEETLLRRCLESVLIAADHLPENIHAHVVLTSDNSVDATPQLAGTLLGARGTVLTTHAGIVGIARAYAASHVIATTASPLHQLWFANTDADCIVPRQWLADQIALAEAGVEAIAGIVAVDSFEEHGPEVPERFRASYFIDADGSHPHIHGANIGIRADAYLRAGGWAELATAEDHDIWRRLTKTGARTCSTARIHVTTSGRRIGRAPHGFAGALAAHNHTPIAI
jgi:glycosyltransferase involved in cell wall biosynthesis